MTPGVRTEAEYRIRTILGPDGRSWIIRDEYDERGEVIGSQQLGSDGRWGEIHLPGTELWDGDESRPTTMATTNRVPGNYTQIFAAPSISTTTTTATPAWMRKQFIVNTTTAASYPQEYPSTNPSTTTTSYPSMMTVNGSTITATSSTTPFLDALSKSHTG